MNNITIPKVSIIMPCYNHEKFVATAIESVLEQTYKDFEFIVADNGSTDNSGNIIETYSDRIKIIKLEKNNPSECTKKLWQAARGEYVAMICSDDYWYPEKLEKQIKKLEEINCNIIFTWAEIVDSNLEKVLDAKRFAPRNQSNAGWLRKMIDNGTIFELSSLLIKNDGRYQRYYKGVSKFRQLPDYALYLNMIFNEPVYVVEEYLVKHRVHGENVSKISFDTRARTFNEFNYLTYQIWKQMEDKMFIEVFSGFVQEIDKNDKTDIMCSRILKYLQYGMDNPELADGALMYCWDHYYDEGVSELLEKKYDISILDIYEYEAVMGSGKLLLENNKNKIGIKTEVKEILASVIRCNEQVINMPDIAVEEISVEEIIKISLNTMIDILGKSINWNFNLREIVDYYQNCNNILSGKIQTEEFGELKDILQNINRDLMEIIV